MAARLAAADPGEVALAGQGLRDVTRIAASNAALWADIVSGNAGSVAAVLADLVADLGEVLAALRDGTADPAAVVSDLIRRGGEGRHRIPAKHGGAAATYAVVPVVVPDRPRALAELFTAVADLGVNVEDVSIEHSPGQPVGLLAVSVRPDVAPSLATALRARGWVVQ
jgi:prephenate dehydrogenase